MNGFVNTFLSGECWYLFNIYPYDSLKLPYILQVIKKSNIYKGYTKIYKNDSNPKRIRFLRQPRLLLATLGNSL